MYYPLEEERLYPNKFIFKQILIWIPLSIPALIFFPDARIIIFGTLFMGIYAAIARYRLRDFFKSFTIRVYNDLIDSIHDYKLKKEYFEDSELWIHATYDPMNFTPRKRILAFLLLALPGGMGIFFFQAIAWIPEITMANASSIFFPSSYSAELYSILLLIPEISNELFLFLTYFCLIITSVFYSWVMYWTVHLYLIFFMNNSILHHFTFWDQMDDISRLPKGNVMGHFFTLNLFFWILSNVILLNHVIGVATALSGWVYSQTNPRHRYYHGMAKQYKIIFQSLYILLPLGCLFGGIQIYWVTQDWLFPVTQLLMVIFFLLIITRLFVMDVEAFDIEKIKPIWRRLGDKLNIKSKYLITIINISPFFLFFIVQYLINPIRVYFNPELDISLGLDIQQLWALGTGSFLMFIASTLICIELMKMEQELRKMAIGFIPKIKPHKVEEHKFHYWECFSSPIATLFAITLGFIFFASMHNAYLKLQLERSGWALFGPIYIVVYLFGASIGVLIWQIVNGIHYIWHCLILTVPFGANVSEDYFKPMIHEYRAEIEGTRRRSYNILIANIVGILGLVLVIEQNPYYAILISSAINFVFLYIINDALDKIIELKPDHRNSA